MYAGNTVPSECILVAESVVSSARMSLGRLMISRCLGEPGLPRIVGGSHGTEQS
jgi:hypothetical protein